MNNREELSFFTSRAVGRKGYSERVRSVFEESLQRKGLFMTGQRRAILDLLLVMTPKGLEVKCKRCKRIKLIPIAEDV